jgi:hypothetical protein
MKIPTIGVEGLSEGFYSKRNDSESETAKIVNPIMNATFPTLALALSTAASPTDNNVLQSVTGTGTWLQMSLPTINHDEVLSGSDLSAINKSEGTVAANAARTRFTRTAALTHREFFRVAHSKAFIGMEKLPNFPLATPVKAGSLSS